MYQLPAITVAIYFLGFWCAYARIQQFGGERLLLWARVSMGIASLIFIAIAASLITGSTSSVIAAECFVLCLGQTVGYTLCGKRSCEKQGGLACEISY